VKLVQDDKISLEDAAQTADSREEFMLAFRGIKKS